MPDTNRIANGPVRASKNALTVILLTQSLRYWLLLAWALALGVCAGWPVALAWLAVSVAVGVVRGRLERRLAVRDSDSVGRTLTMVATGSSALWATAPAIVYAIPGAWSLVVTTCMIVSGYLLVVTQFRTMPQRSMIVSAPYSLVTLGVGYSLIGRPEFLPFLTCVGVVGSAIFANLLFGYHDRVRIETFQSEQARLIGELETARDRADAANSAKSSFLAMISHELRTPMNGVLGAAQLLDGTALEPAQRTYVGMIRNSGGSLLGLLNDILDFAKIEAGRVELEIIETSLRDLVERVGGVWAAQAGAKGLAFEMSVDPGTPGLVLADPTRLSQILHNLLSNAVKFTDTGVVRLSVGAERLSIDRVALTLSVSDSGPGISAEDQARLFQPFSQLDASSTRRFGGTGLGLAISRRLTEMMDGALTVESGPGGGSTFALAFEAPVLAWSARASAEPDNAPRADVSSARQRVLVVEDHPINRQLLEIWLDTQGHVHTSAENGKIALEVAASQAFDLVLMDVNMPVMDGLSAVRALRAGDGPNRDVAVVMLSASARAEDHIAGFEAGADAYLNKPLDFAQLSAVMAQTDLRGGAARSVEAA